ncbi:glycosyltransferase family 4 protein [Alkalinema pantanalense CENA528]|uniref:glycosyltransferase family 4 protein n=1 Tax=Alkalinema pantanalense TaxID=1620705 RepID=UPI003D6E75C3
MKPLLLSTYDITGGAARAAYRLHQGLQEIGLESQMLVQNKASDDRSVIAPRSKLQKTIAFLRPGIDGLPLNFYRQRQIDRYSPAWLPEPLTQQIAALQPDIVNLHWMGSGFLRLETLRKLRQPIVWTMHDMWAFTGGCHYSDGCDRYEQTCGACPKLNSQKPRDLSRWIWRRKQRAWQRLNLTIVTPSCWLAQCAAQSSLLKPYRVEIIPYGLDLQRYRPYDRDDDRAMVRKILNLPLDVPLILFGAADATRDRRKGFHVLQAALQSLSQQSWPQRPELVIFGASQPEVPPDLGFPTHYLGTLGDEISLSLAYAAADVFVAPSLEDNLPNTVLEALACGTPCVAFKIGGMPDMIIPGETGYLAQPYRVQDLAQGIRWVLMTDRPLRAQARAHAEKSFALTQQAQRYQRLFQELLS